MELLTLYDMYLQELSAKYGIYREDETAESILSDYEVNCHEVKMLKAGESNVGFLIIGRHPDCHPMCDRFICQAYIMPEFRGTGLMHIAAGAYIAENYGRYCLDIINGNIVAERFWEKVFSEMGYKRVSLPDVKRNLTDITVWYFEPEGYMPYSPKNSPKAR